ncbi:MAG: UPF0280 family protein [Candidatus Omnitrophica bacterium]|nr:UPF0280 family protein [Candidatus Omnitrophota bacterium]
MYKARTYRRWVEPKGLVPFEVIEKETDLAISASKVLEAQARAAVLTFRQDLENYIKMDRSFLTSLAPVDVRPDAPAIVKMMADAAFRAGVGPMAAVAGAVAEMVGRELLKYSGEVIVENGGDIFMKTDKKTVIGIYAGASSPFTGKIALEVAPGDNGLGVCTSSGTVSHSLSFGKSDAVVIISEEASLADAVATATGNILKAPGDIEKAINFAKSIKGITGVLVIMKDKMGSWGDIKLIE